MRDLACAVVRIVVRELPISVKFFAVMGFKNPINQFTIPDPVPSH
jgi:hypothetical protein